MPATRFHPSLIWIGLLLLLLPLLLGSTHEEVAPAGTRGIGTAELDDRRCIEALYQLELLVGKYKVYKPGTGDARTYLDDRNRPAEIERLGKVRDEACSAEQPLHGSQQRRAAELFQALSADCREAREELRLLERPESRTSRNEYERHVDWMSRYCPDLPDAESHTDVWLADRVWQWHTR
ncbi:MAG TPA: hypothetical protein VFI92_05100 [Steroidobacteraceae bacterium]|nr:hypothetical protein [Steroidobacteraceae bacterium]